MTWHEYFYPINRKTRNILKRKGQENSILVSEFNRFLMFNSTCREYESNKKKQCHEVIWENSPTWGLNDTWRVCGTDDYLTIPEEEIPELFIPLEELEHILLESHHHYGYKERI